MTGAADVRQRLALVRAQIAAAAERVGRPATSVELLAVSKLQSTDAIRAAHAAGQRAFGENRVQELAAKARELAALTDLRWHMIGSLQTNKVRELLRVPGLSLLHSLDRVRLADELQRELGRVGRRLDVLIEVHVTDEPTKHGCPLDAAPALLAHVQAHCPALAMCGLMAIGPQDGDPAPAFARAAALRGELQRRSGLPLPVLSLGMSGDLSAAIAAGSTIVRIGTAVFGSRG